MAKRWIRTDDGVSEILTVVRVDGDEKYYVEICAGPNVGDDFVGLYTLDGDQIPFGNREWTTVSDPPAEVVEAIESDWESGSSVVRLLDRAVQS